MNRSSLKLNQIRNRFHRLAHHSEKLNQIQLQGQVTSLKGLCLEVKGLQPAIGNQCIIQSSCHQSIEAEVVSFYDNKSYLMCTEHLDGIALGDTVRTVGSQTKVAIHNDILGKVLDGNGRIIDGSSMHGQDYKITGKKVNPLSKKDINQVLDTGVKSINSFCTLGEGQRIGLFAPSGAGKSVLLGMINRFSKVDVVVIALVGERSREVKEFIDHNLTPDTRNKTVIVTSTAGEPALLRVRAGLVATTIAEYFRDQGKRVLLLFDSLTRFAHAQREIGLAIGEPPTTKGYTPSVFSKLNHLLERAGNSEHGQGTMTAIYTVLLEDEVMSDPVGEAVRSILDGHVVLSRKLAEMGQYPAIDIQGSISRVMNHLVEPAHLEQATQFRRLYAHYHHHEDMINFGSYQAGSDPMLDLAIEKIGVMKQYLSQDTQSCCSYQQSLTLLNQLLAKTHASIQ